MRNRDELIGGVVHLEALHPSTRADAVGSAAYCCCLISCPRLEMK